MTMTVDHTYVEIVSVTPADGVWAVYKAPMEDGDTRYRRQPVRVWALVRSPVSLATSVVPMIEGDGLALDFVDSSCLWLWNEVSGDRCDCGYCSLPSWTASDRWWCRKCAGLIEIGR